MAFQSVFYKTELSDSIINELVDKFDSQLDLKEAKINDGIIDKKIRNCNNAPIHTDHWLSGLIWYYIDKANKNEFMYDISNIDYESINYLRYDIGQFYKWHSDSSIDEYLSITRPGSSGKPEIDYVNEKIGVEYELTRKLSFSIQLTDPSEYDGGELQFMSDSFTSYYAPKEKGTLIIFDSRARHRVKKVTRGVRKSIVGWVVGPRWK